MLVLGPLQQFYLHTHVPKTYPEVKHERDSLVFYLIRLLLIFLEKRPKVLQNLLFLKQISPLLKVSTPHDVALHLSLRGILVWVCAKVT